MRNSLIVMTFFLLFFLPVLSFSKNQKVPNPNLSAVEHANENAKFKRSKAKFHNKAHKKARKIKKAEENVKKAEEEKKKIEEAQDKGEGQVKVKF